MPDFNLPKNSTILLDTNFLIDSFSQEEKYADVFEHTKLQGITLVSIDLVRVEFIRSKTKDVVRKKSLYFEKLIEALLPLEKEISKLLQPTIEEYGNDTDGLEVTDIFLACFIKRYKNLLLLTRNHKDFPTRIFTRSHIFAIEDKKDIKTYALYQYKPTESEIETPVDPRPEEIPF